MNAFKAADPRNKPKAPLPIDEHQRLFFRDHRFGGTWIQTGAVAGIISRVALHLRAIRTHSCPDSGYLGLVPIRVIVLVA
jgi:hypothetical protein